MTRISIGSYEPAHLSFSTVNGYRSCGKRFELQKVLRLEEKPGLAAIGGNAVHKASEDFDLGKWIPSDNELDIVLGGVEDDSTDEGSAE